MNDESFRFGAYRLDAAKRELERDGTLLALTPQVFDCLTYLLRHRERAVGRDELIAAVWGRADVTDTLLAQTVMHARRAVGDSGGEQSAIRTIPRFGYRWILPVQAGEAASVADTPAEPASAPAIDTAERAHDRNDDRVDERSIAPARSGQPPPPAASTSPSRLPRIAVRRPLWLGLAAFGIAAAVLVWMMRPDDEPAIPPPPASATARPVLVVPVAVAPVAETVWVPLGLMDAIAGRLRDGGWPVVPSATAVALARDGAAAADPLRLAREAGAGLTVAPTAERDGGRWRVRFDLHGATELPASVSAEAPELLDAARLASDRLLALLRRQPLPEQIDADPDRVLAEWVQRIESEFLADRLDAAEVLLDTAPAALRDRPELKFQAVQLDYRAGRLDRAGQGFQAMLDTLSPEAQPVLRARSLIGLGSIARTRARFDEAEPLYREAIALLDPLNQPVHLGTAWAYLGVSLGSLHRFDESAAALGRARAILEGTGDAFGVAIVDAGFATMQADRRRLADAAPRLAQAIERFERLGAQAEANGLRIALAQMYRELLDHPAALAVSATVWAQVRDQPSQRLYPMAAAVHALALIESGRLAEAGRVLDGIERQDGRHDAAYQWRQVRYARAHLDLERRRPAAAAGVLEVLLADEAAVPGDAGPVWRSWLTSLRAQGLDTAARAELPRVARWAARVDEEARMHADLIAAEQHLADHEPDLAYARYEAALQAADRIGVPRDIARVAASYGHALIRAGWLERAATVTGRLAAWADRDFDCALVQARLHQALGQAGPWREALERARDLAGERGLPEALDAEPLRHALSGRG
jgi:DNA-binding winged helix-turn-helix (wHTH) protein/tetratricopeptide (TPR) repeat protein